jgi:hypothetical protein
MNSVKKDINHNFGDNGKKILKKAFDIYNENAKDYQLDVFKQKFEDLNEKLMSAL